MASLSRTQILDARQRLLGRVLSTPCRESFHLSRSLGGTVRLKLENLQVTGSFKERGAANKLLQLSDAQRKAGVVAASAGNHAQAVAYHAEQLGIAATLVMPESTPLVKVMTTRRFGPNVILHGAGYDDAAALAEQLRNERGLALIHPFDDQDVMAGQGTIGLEILEQFPDVEAIVVPVGGGGLIAGIAAAVKEARSDVLVYGVESETFPGMKRVLETDNPPEILGGKTIADGIAVRHVGELTRNVVLQYVDGIALVEEEEIAEAIVHLLEGEKTLAEGAGAVGIAALVHGHLPIAGRKVAVVVSGGNIDVNLVSRVIERGLVKTGRLVRFGVVAPDVIGVLSRMTAAVAELRANILDIEHDRAFSGVELGESLIELVLETRGAEHVREVAERLEREGFRVERR
jgi:threonine dehydratase